MFMRTIGLMLLIPPLSFGATGVFKWSEDGAPSTFDPVQAAVRYSTNIVEAVYDTLYQYRYLKKPYELKPNLATSMPQVSEDGLVYTIKLKKGVHFIDDECFPQGKGREVVAGDFVYSIKRHFDSKNRSQGAWLWQGRIAGLDQWKKDGSDYSKKIEGLSALDSHTVQIKLVKPYPQLLYTLAMGFSAVVPKEAVEKYGREFSVHPVGSGPFKLVSFNTKKAVLERNRAFREDIFDLKAEGYDKSVHSGYGLEILDGKRMPMVDKVEISFMKQEIARWNSFTKGSEVQFTWVPPEQVPSVVEVKSPLKLKPDYEKKYHSRLHPNFAFVHTDFNMDDERIGYNKDPKRQSMNKELRCAIRDAFNWPQRINRFYAGIGTAFPGVIPRGVAGYDSTLSSDSVTHNPKRAKERMAKAGWNAKNLPTLEYGGVSSVRNKQFFEQFRGWLVKIGYPRNKIKLKQFATFGDYNKAVKKRKVMIIGMGWGLDYPDAQNVLQLFYGPYGSPGSNNSNFDNPEYNDLYAKATIMQPSPERNAMYRRMNEILIDECVSIVGYSRTRIMLWHKNVVLYPTTSLPTSIYKYAYVNPSKIKS